MKTRPWWFYRQSGVIPYRVAGAGVEIMLITSRRRARWIIPKGVVDLGAAPEESALKEAFEEAGLEGEATGAELGEYEYEKWGGTCRVRVYLMRVVRVLDDWPESGARERRWMTVEQAAEAVREERLKELILTAARSLNAT
ncbi:MAG TPA: NUDIX hydrolase [Pyrinomonadaceae bacterium]|nr:NUDIX hydrolase [Pyrinomonadaceae bacterium]